MFFHVSRQCILVFFRYPGNWFGGRVVGWHVWKKRATIVHPFPRERMRLMHEVVEARGFFVCFSLASVCYQDLLRIVMNENVIRICHLGNLYRNSSLFGGVGDPHERKLVVEKDGERKVVPERKRKGDVSLSKTHSTMIHACIFDTVHPRSPSTNVEICRILLLKYLGFGAKYYLCEYP